VSDFSSGIFMQKYYQALKEPGKTKAEALHIAQLSLKEMTAGEAIEYCQAAIQALDPETDAEKYPALATALARFEMLADQPQRPDHDRKIYSHPFHWAPFTLVGDWQ
jgi:CHAT domain-containing protein